MNSLNFLKQALTAPESLISSELAEFSESTDFGGLSLSVKVDALGVAINLKEMTEHEGLTLVRTVFFLGTELGGEKPVLSVSIIDSSLANRLLELLEERLSSNEANASMTVEAEFVDLHNKNESDDSIPAIPADAV